jgi:hypothetical protein
VHQHSAPLSLGSCNLCTQADDAEHTTGRQHARRWAGGDDAEHTSSRQHARRWARGYDALRKE